jgi:Mn-dependent DtxR family transcriptional regulator
MTRVPRSKRKNEALEALYRQDGAGMTRREIALALGLSKSPFILSMMHELENEGLVVKVWDEEVFPPTYRYFLASTVGE